MGDVIIAASPPVGAVDFGGGPVTGSFAVAKFDASGSCVWSKGFGASNEDTVVGLAAYNDKQILVGGNFVGTLDFGTMQVSTTGASGIFLAKLSLP